MVPLDGRALPVDEIGAAASAIKAAKRSEAGAGSAGSVEKVNGRLPINSRHAGDEFPLSDALKAKYPKGLKFNEKGYPDFTPYSIANPEPKGIYEGGRAQDVARANEKAGLTGTPEGYTWHHHEDGKTMQLVPMDLHEYVRHTGGIAKYGRHRKAQY